MIEVRDSYSFCNSCTSRRTDDNKDFAITTRNINQATLITLCRSCRLELSIKLLESLKIKEVN